MASLSDITQKIIDDAQIRANEILSAANREAEEVYAASRQEVADKRESMMQSAQMTADARRERLLAAAELRGKKQVLETKQTILAQAFDRAVAQIVRMDDQEYDQMMARMAQNVQGDVQPLPRNREAGTGGGFVVKNGKIELNYALEALAKNAKDKLEKELVSMLFE